MSDAAATAADPGGGSIGAAGVGSLRFTRAGERTVVHTAYARSPLRLLLPQNHGTAAWAFVATFGGGLVDGDAIALSVRVDEGARALVGTQASTKVYRSRSTGEDNRQSSGSSQRLDSEVGAGGLLVVAPDPVVCFAAAHYEQRSRVNLAGDASLVLIDGMTCGRASHGERWAFARYATTTRVEHDGDVLVHDAVLLDRAHGALGNRMGRCGALATVVAIGPRARGVRDTLLAAGPPLARCAPLLCSVNALGDAGAIARIAGDDVEPVGHFVRALLAPLAAELGDDPFGRKW